MMAREKRHCEYCEWSRVMRARIGYRTKWWTNDNGQWWRTNRIMQMTNGFWNFGNWFLYFILVCFSYIVVFAEHLSIALLICCVCVTSNETYNVSVVLIINCLYQNLYHNAIKVLYALTGSKCHSLIIFLSIDIYFDYIFGYSILSVLFDLYFFLYINFSHACAAEELENVAIH